MSSKKIILKNTIWLYSSEIISQLLSFIFVVLIARYLGDSVLGVYSFAFAFVSLFVVIFDFGLLLYSVREVAKDHTKTSKYFNNILTLRLLLLLIAMLLPSIIILFIQKWSWDARIVWLAALAMFFNYFGHTFRALFQAYERMESEAISRITERVIALVLGIFFLSRGYGLVALCSVLVLSYLCYFLIISLTATKKITLLRFEFDFAIWKLLIKKSMPFWFSFLFMTFYFRIDTVMLTIIQNYAVTGWYNAAYKLVEGLSFIPYILVLAIYPAMSKFHHMAKDALKLLYKKSIYYLFALALPIAVGVTLLADKLIIFIYKSQFLNSIIALRILIWSELFVFLNYLLGHFLNSIGKQKMFAYSTGICALLNLFLNLIVIPRFSYIGAAFVTLFTQIINLSLLYSVASKENYKVNIPKTITKPVIAVLLMGLFLWYFNHFWSILILIPTAALLYFGLLILIRGFDTHEWDLIRTIIKRE
jgi:O-antigen/teichoic acid export membrane protein